MDWVIYEGGIVQISMEAQATGWVGIGLNLDGEAHEGSDMIIGWVGDDGYGYLYDTTSNTASRPELDESQDVRLIGAEQSGGRTKLVFRRDLNTGDRNDVVISNQRLEISWAYHRDTEGVNSMNYPEHTRRGDTRINFLEGEPILPFVPVETLPPPPTPPPAMGNMFSEGSFSVSWTIDGDVLEMTMSARATGWIGVGWTTGVRGHSRSDMIVGWVDAAGTAVVIDAYSNSRATPVTDSIQNVMVVDSVVMNGVTSITFRKPLDSGENTQDVALVDAPILFLYAYHTTAKGSATGNYAQHSVFGSRMLNLVAGGDTGIPDAPQTTAPPMIDLPEGFGGYTNSDGKFRVQWQMFLDTEEIEITISADTEGWVGFGWTEGQNAHSGCDMYVGWVLDDGSVVLIDASSDATILPREDEQQDAQLISGEKSNGVTTLTFRRRLDTLDSDDLVVKDMEVLMHWAYHDTAPVQGREYAEHFERGLGVVNFHSVGAISSSISSSNYQTDIAFVYSVSISAIILLSAFLHHKKRFKKRKMYSSKPDPDSMIAPILGNQKTITNSRLSSFISRVLKTRVKTTQIPLMDFMILTAYAFFTALLLFAFGTENLNDAFGYLTIANAFFVAITATRNSVITVLLHLSFERLIQFHRWLGMCTFAYVSAHFTLYTYEWIQLGVFRILITSLSNVYGLLGLISLGIIFLTSLEWFRRKMFNVFYVSHFTFLAFFAFGCFHSSEFVPYALSAAGFYMIDRLIRFVFGLFQHRLEMTQVMENGMVRIRFPKRHYGMYRLGGYVFLNFPALNFWEFHPFTIASGPNEPYVEVNIRDLGDYTHRVVAHVKKQRTSDIFVRSDGPYGVWRFNYARYPHITLIAGGIGVTPVLALLRHIFDYNSEHIHNEAILKSVTFIWTCPDTTTYNWFSDVIEDIQLKAGEEGYPQLDCKVYLSKVQQTPSDLFIAGRPEMTTIVKDIKSETSKQNIDRCLTIACGPRAMVNAAWDASTRVSDSTYGIDFHHEVFEF